MNNNDILRRIRYIFDFNDSKMIDLFNSVNYEVTREDVSDWLKKEDDESYTEISDTELAIFLNALIIEKRGKREGTQPEPENELSNNIIFRKIKIALDLKAEDIIGIFLLIDKKISMHELSAFFRKTTHKSYKPCQDQYLRNFLSGLQMKYRNTSEAKGTEE